MRDTESRLLDSIYASIHDPGALDEAFEGLARACHSRAAGVFRLRGPVLDWNHVYGMPAEFMPAFGARVPDDPRIVHGLRQPPLTVMTDAEPNVRCAMRAADIDQFLGEHDLPWTVSCTLAPIVDQTALALFVSRGASEGPPNGSQLAAFGHYMPHFARAFALRKQMQAMITAATRAEDNGEPRRGLLAVDKTARVRWLDGGAIRLLEGSHGLKLSGGRLRFADAAIAARFVDLLRSLVAGRPRAINRLDVPQARPDSVLSLCLLPNSDQPAHAPVMVSLRRIAPAAAGSAGTPSPRQRQVLELLAEGLSSKLIGARLDIAENTVRNHIQALLRLFNVPNRGACVARAREWGWLD